MSLEELQDLPETFMCGQTTMVTGNWYLTVYRYLVHANKKK